MPETPRKRRFIASAKRIEDSIRAAQNRGLTPTAIAHHPDGRTVVHFGPDAEAQEINAATGWEDFTG